jgi:hypothetical protein
LPLLVRCSRKVDRASCVAVENRMREGVGPPCMVGVGKRREEGVAPPCMSEREGRRVLPLLVCRGQKEKGGRGCPSDCHG